MRDQAGPMELALRRATDADLSFLLDLRLRTMHRHFVASGANPSDDEHMLRILHHFECAQIVLVERVRAGLLKLDRNETPWHLIQIQLLPELQGRGLGERLLREIIREARGAGVAVRLGVLKLNPARRLYERLGFVVVEDRGDSFAMHLPAVRE